MDGIIRIVVAVAIGVAILGAGRWGIRLLTTPQPEEPDPEEVVDVEVPFVCTVCGLRLTVTQAQDEEWNAPKHCREEMVLEL
jgi:NhaP-type Na+/H+ or K+/H+ antiporter